MRPIDSEDDVKALGINWNPKTNSFTLSVLPKKNIIDVAMPSIYENISNYGSIRLGGMNQFLII